VPAPEAIAPAPVVLPPDQYAPPGSQNLYALSASQTVGPGPALVTLGAVTQLGVNQIARLAVWSVQVLNLLPTSLVTFRLRINGNPQPGLTRQIPAAPLLVFARDFDVYLVTPQGATIDVQVQVDDAAAYQVQSFYTGWTYTLAQQQHYYAALAGIVG